jgi:hypothetical protein
VVPLDLVEKISNAVAAEPGSNVDVIVVVSASGEAGRVELLVALKRNRIASRRLLNLSREEPVVFERQLRTRLQEMASCSSRVERQSGGPFR